MLNSTPPVRGATCLHVLSKKCGHEKPQGARSCDFCDQDLNTPSDSTITDVVRSSGFVGRQRELGELTSALGDAISGHGRLVLLGGDPGIGKTCIVQELAAIADARSADVFWEHCYEGEGAPPYWPWFQILRSCVAESDAERFEAAMGSDAEAFGEIVPELRSKLPNLGVPPTFDPDSARFRLFDSITTYLKNASNDRPIVLMLEDLHWADASSLALLEHIIGDMAESNLLIVGTYRDNEVSLDHSLSRILGNVLRHDGFQSLDIGSLTLGDVGELVTLSGGSDMPRDSGTGASHDRGQRAVRWRTPQVTGRRRAGRGSGVAVRLPPGNQRGHKQTLRWVVRRVQSGADGRRR